LTSSASPPDDLQTRVPSVYRIVQTPSAVSHHLSHPLTGGKYQITHPFWVS
jgi:hypothetical protein